MSIWREIKCVHFDEEEQKWFLDAWLTDAGWEEGKVIAKVDSQCNVEYIDKRAKTDAYAQEIIATACFDALANKAYGLYIEAWCNHRGYDIKDYDDENGFNGVSFACFDEFSNVEFRDEECMTHLLDKDMALWHEIINKQRHSPPLHTGEINLKSTIMRRLYIAGIITHIVCLILFIMDFYRPITLAVMILITIAIDMERAVKDFKRKNKIAFFLDIISILILIIFGILYAIHL